MKARSEKTKGNTKDIVLPVGKSLVMNTGRSNKKMKHLKKHIIHVNGYHIHIMDGIY